MAEDGEAEFTPVVTWPNKVMQTSRETVGLLFLICTREEQCSYVSYCHRKFEKKGEQFSMHLYSPPSWEFAPINKKCDGRAFERGCGALLRYTSTSGGGGTNENDG